MSKEEGAMRSWFVTLSLISVLVAIPHAKAQTNGNQAFLRKSAQGNVYEVEMAKLALQKAVNADVKSFAQQMITDHEMLEAKMKGLLDKDGVPVPGSMDKEHQKEFDTLNGFSGDDFDREYVKAMDQDHHKDLKAFNKELASTKDPELKAAVQDGQQVIARHTRMIDGISAKMKLSPPGQTEREAGRVIR